MAFIVFEGGEATGKTTQAGLLAARLGERGVPARFTREPGGTPLAESIRALFKAVAHHGDSPLPLTELMLVMAARAQHVAKVIAPALAAGEVVVCDRFLDSTYVYQGARGGLPKELMDGVAAPCVGMLVPDLTLVFVVPPEVAQARLASRAGTLPADRLDEEGDAVRARLDEGFRRLVSEETPYPLGQVPRRVLIHGEGTPEQVFEAVWACVHPLLGGKSLERYP